MKAQAPQPSVPPCFPQACARERVARSSFRELRPRAAASTGVYSEAAWALELQGNFPVSPFSVSATCDLPPTQERRANLLYPRAPQRPATSLRGPALMLSHCSPDGLASWPCAWMGPGTPAPGSAGQQRGRYPADTPVSVVRGSLSWNVWAFTWIIQRGRSRTSHHSVVTSQQ